MTHSGSATRRVRARQVAAPVALFAAWWTLTTAMILPVTLIIGHRYDIDWPVALAASAAVGLAINAVGLLIDNVPGNSQYDA